MACLSPGVRSPTALRSALGLALLIVVAQGAGAAAGATLTVNSFDQDGTLCTLTSAILSANANSNVGGCVASGAYGADTILLERGTYALTHAHDGEDGLPAITDDLTIQGNGATITRPLGASGPFFRILHATAGDLTLVNLTVTGGRVVGFSAWGGGLLFEAPGRRVTLDGCALSGNQVVGTDPDSPEFVDARGGGMYARDADLVDVQRSRLTGNTAAADGDPIGGLALGGGLAATDVRWIRIGRSVLASNGVRSMGIEGGGFGGGGAIHAESPSAAAGPAALEVSLSQLTDNSVDTSATGGADSFAGVAYGGAALLEGDFMPVVTVTGTAILRNLVRASGDFGGDAEGGGLRLSYFGDPAGATVTGSTIDGNTATAGGVQQAGLATGGGIGALLPDGGTLAIGDSSITNNLARALGPDGFGIGGGLDFFALDAAVALTSTTVGNNRVEAALASGGGISFDSEARLDLLNATISGNEATGLPPSSGGGVFATEMRPQNSILAGNTAGSGPDCDATVVSPSHNLVGDTDGCPGFAASETGKPAGLGALTGSTRPGSIRFPLLDGSAALDAGDPFTCPVRDQVGQLRAGACDGGALEKVAPTVLVFSVLPNSRAGAPGDPLTAFVTAINAGTAPAYQVGIDAIAPIGLPLGTPFPAMLGYQTTNSDTNALEGTPDTPVDIPPGQPQSWVMAITPTATFGPTQLQIGVGGPNASPIPPIPGVSTILVSADDPRPADVVALTTTGTVDLGVLASPTMAELAAGFFAVATVNLGKEGPITVATNTGAAVLPLTVAVCATDPLTSVCLSSPQPSVTVPIGTGDTPTFAVFIAAEGTVGFDPAVNRIFVTFTDGGGVVRGGTSVAVRTVP